MSMLKSFKKRILPFMLCAALVFPLVKPYISEIFAASGFTVIQSSGSEAEQFKSFIDDNILNNLIAGITPSVVEEGTTVAVSNTASGWSVLTDGNYSTRKTLFPTGKGSGILRYTYSLEQSVSVSELLVVCRENNTNMYALEYEIYVSDSFSDLYNQTSMLFKKSGNEYTAGGQLVKLTGTKPTGKYIGFRLTDAKNKYHLGELGVYGNMVASNTTVKQTTSNSQEVEDFIDGNKDKNILKGIVPSVSEEGTTVEVNDIVSGWEAVTDGNYNTSKIVFPTGLGNGILRYTYSLPFRTQITDLLVVCRENDAGIFALEYEIYFSETITNLYNSENLIFQKKGGNYTEGGQLITFKPEAMPKGSFVGFRLTKAENKYHLGELGVYGIELEALNDVKQTNTNAAEFETFIQENLEKNILKGLTPSVLEEETSIGVNDVIAGWPAVTDGSYNTYKTIFPTGRGNGVLRYTYALPNCIEVTNFLMVCRQNDTGMFALEYEIYASEMSDELYNLENLVFEKTLSNYTEGGQLVTFTESKRPKCYFIGIRLKNAVNKYHVSEIGIYGNVIEDTVPYITQHTLTDLSAIKAQIADGNHLKGIVPTLYDYMLPEMPWKEEFDNSSASNWISCNGKWDMLTDGELFTTSLENKRRVDIMQGKKKGGLVLTYELKETVLIDKIVMIGMWGGFGDYCTQEYKLYVSDSLDDLYDGSNLVLTYNNEDRFNPSQQYSGAGQMFSFNNKPSGKYFGIRFTIENNTDQMVRLEEIGIFGNAVEDKKVNILDNKLCNVYLSDDIETNLTNNLISPENRILLTNGDLNDNVPLDTQGKKIEFVYDLCKEFTIDEFALTTVGNSAVKEYTVYAGDFAEQMYSDEFKLGVYKSESETTSAVLKPDKAINARYIRIIISDYSGTHLAMSEIAAIGSVLENRTVKNVVNDIDEESISAWLTDDTYLEKNAQLKEGDMLKNLVDRNNDTTVQLYGAANLQTIDILFKLPNLKLINGFKYTSGSDTMPKNVRYYVGETQKDVFGEEAEVSAEYNYSEGDKKSQSSICVPKVGLYIRVSITAAEKAADDTFAATVAQLEINGLYVEGFLDPSGDKTVLKSFEDEQNGLSVKVLKLYSNDIWSDIVRMSINKREPMNDEATSLAGLGLKVYNSVLEVCFYNSENKRITDLGGRKLTVTFTIPEGEGVAYMAQSDEQSIWILNASYDGNKMFYELLPEEITYFFALAVEDETSNIFIPIVDDVIIPDDEKNNDIPSEELTDNSDEEDGKKDDKKPQWESQIGKGNLVKATVAKVINIVHPAVWYSLIAVIAVELIAIIIFIICYIRKKIKKGEM